MATEQTTATIGVVIDLQTKARLEKMAQEEDRSLAAVIRRIINDFFKPAKKSR
jgi:hypothetical protein